MTALTEQVGNLTVLNNIESELYSATSAARGGLDRALSAGVDRAEDLVAKTQADVDKVKAKYNNHPAGIPIWKPYALIRTPCPLNSWWQDRGEARTDARCY